MTKFDDEIRLLTVQSLSYVASDEWTIIPERVVDFGHNLVLFLLCFAIYINKRSFESAKKTMERHGLAERWQH